MQQDSRILVIDDDEAQLRLLVRLLHREGYADVHTTTRPGEALALAHELRPDLIVLDVHVGTPDGFTLLSNLRWFDEEDDPVPVLMVTGDTSPATRRCALERGASDFLTRPFDLVEVRHRVRSLVRMRALRRVVARERADLARRVADVLEHLRTGAGPQIDPRVVESLLAIQLRGEPAEVP